MTAQLSNRARPDAHDRRGDLQPAGRLGFWTAGHFRTVLIGWVLIAVGFGLTLA